MLLMLAVDNRILVVLGLPQAGSKELQQLLQTCGAPQIHELETTLAQALEASGTSWNSTSSLNEVWFQSRPAQQASASIKPILEPLPDGDGLRVLQLPGLERILPIWQQVDHPLAHQCGYVLLLRHPLDVAEELRSTKGWSRDRGLLLWLQSNLTMERHSRHHQRVFIQQEKIFWDVDAALNQLEQQLSLQFPERNHERLLGWEQQLPEGYQQSRQQLDNSRTASPLLNMALQLHEWLEAKTRGEELQPHLPDVINQQLDWAEALYGRTLIEQDLERRRAEEKLAILNRSRVVRLRRWLAG